MKRMVLILLPAAFLAMAAMVSDELTFTNRLISADYTYGYAVGLADLDKDGHLDIVSTDCTTYGSRKHNDIYWYENDGKGNFARHFLARDDWYGRYERFRIADMNSGS